MKSENKNKIKYVLTFLIPVLVIIGLIVGGIGTGIITFNQDSSDLFLNPNEESENQNHEDKIKYINATVEIFFNNDVKYSRIFQLEEKGIGERRELSNMLLKKDIVRMMTILTLK